jgi:hypothetical protein
MAPFRALVLAFALLLFTSASATAAPRAVTSFVPSNAESIGGLASTAYSGPYLAGGQVAWTRNLHAGGWVVERAAAGRRITRIATLPRPIADHHFVRMRGASGTRTAYTDYAYDVGYGRSGYTTTVRNVMSATTLAPGSSRELAGCGGGSRPPCACRDACYGDEFQGALSGDTLAYVHGLSGDIVVADLASSAAPVRIDRGATIYGLHMAGDVLAWQEEVSGGTPRTVVYDRRAGRELYRVDGLFPRAVQADGKAVTSDLDGRLRWHSPAEPGAHRFDRPAGTRIADARLAKDRLLFVETGSGPARLMLAPLSGGGAKEIATESCCGYDRPFASFDFDGTSATWARSECGLVTIVLERDVTRVTAPWRPSSACGTRPPAIAQFRFASGGRLAVDLTCREGCRGTVALYEVERSSHSRLGRRTVDFRPSARAHRLYITPPAPARERIAKLARLRVQGVFTGRDGRGHRVADTRTGTLKRP